MQLGIEIPALNIINSIDGSKHMCSIIISDIPSDNCDIIRTIVILSFSGEGEFFSKLFR